MAVISMDVDTAGNAVVLSGDVEKLIQHRLAWRYMKDYLHPIVNNGLICVPISAGNTITILSSIRNMLKKYGFEEKQSSTSEQVMRDFYEEERKFEEFSKKALSIRNNICDYSEFSAFTNIVAHALKARSLYPLQLLSAFHLAFAQNACNFSVPGSGKTSIVYGAYAYLKSLTEDNPKEVDKLLIVCPLSAFGPWELEFKECFGFAPISKRLISDISHEDKVDYLYSGHTAELTMISYASLVSVQDAVIFFLKYNRVMVVLDEAHKVKNTAGGVTAKAALEISRYCRARVVLTGTPAPNGYEDLYNMFQFIWPTKRVIGYGVNQLRDMSTKKHDMRINRMIENISPFFIRIKKSDLGIPTAIIHDPIFVDMGPVQQRIYDYIEKKFISELLEGNQTDGGSRFKALLMHAKVIRLMQAATNPSMLKAPICDFLQEDYNSQETYPSIMNEEVIHEIFEYENTEIPSKYIATYKLVEEIIKCDGKVVIWATFLHTIHELHTYLANLGIPSQELYGAIPVEKEGIIEEPEAQVITRERIVNEFMQNTCPYKVLIANPFAVSESISLHKACHHAIYIERSFNAAHFVQSKDRIHRFGLKPTDETHYYYILSRCSIDETINTRLEEKERRMIEIMESMPIPLFLNASYDLGDEDIKALLQDYAKRTRRN